jgi:hypothetical protein
MKLKYYEFFWMKPDQKISHKQANANIISGKLYGEVIF